MGKPETVLPKHKGGKERDEKTVREIGILPPLSYQVIKNGGIQPGDQDNQDSNLPPWISPRGGRGKSVRCRRELCEVTHLEMRG